MFYVLLFIYKFYALLLPGRDRKTKREKEGREREGKDNGRETERNAHRSIFIELAPPIVVLWNFMPCMTHLCLEP